ncbi:DUF4421 domain-containing protein [Chitinophaga sp.]|uniref:DUF4421 domain-containing protein n=1 Tax=Chitinophaga sp. TaxID=1869181 RepID=UPI00260B823E|nr:DUF4421 domain-containing protein [uncultured Chitinophaga sp.]
MKAICWILLLCPALASAQESRLVQWLRSENDSNYVEDLTRDLTVRVYGSRKYNYYDMHDRRVDEALLYRPNANNNVGVGFNYKFIGLNLGFNLPFINNDDDRFGKTKYLDLQTHLYTRKLVVDFYGQYYQGYYSSTTRRFFDNAISGRVEGIRPDIINTNIGLHGQYIFNDKRFSYRAAFLQNEYQKKSAGSPLVGAELFAWQMRGDSALVPADARKDGFYEGMPFTRSSNISLAINAGYAYTLVIAEHWFITGSLALAAGVNRSVLGFNDGNGKEHGLGWQLNSTFRFAAGYNSRKYYVGVHYVDISTRGGSPLPKTWQSFGAGNLRFSIVRRFALKKPLFGS